MIKCYVGTKVIRAEPHDQDGKAGYRVYYPDGYTSWSPKAVFEVAYREITQHERQLIDMTDAEASIAAISDGDPEGGG